MTHEHGHGPHHGHGHGHEHRPHHQHPPRFFDRGMHPLWFMIIGAILIGLTVLAWTIVAAL